MKGRRCVFAHSVVPGAVHGRACKPAWQPEDGKLKSKAAASVKRHQLGPYKTALKRYNAIMQKLTGNAGEGRHGRRSE